MARLAALQPRSSDELLVQWAESRHEDVADLRGRLDPTDARYDHKTFRAWIGQYQSYLMGLISEAGTRGVDLLLLPEGTLPTGVYKRASMEAGLREVCQWSTDAYLAEVATVARQYRMVVASCLNYVDDGDIVNAGILTDENGKVAGIYRKTHLPSYEDEPESRSEAAALSAGNEYPVFETKVGKVGFQICYDIIFPEPSRVLALQGADVILHPSVGYNFPDEEEVIGEARLRVRAAENSVALVYSNFAVRSPTYSCGGRSCVVDRRGAMVACAGRQEGLALADVDLEAPRIPGWLRPGYEHREHLWRKRRPDTYGLLTELHPPVLSELRESKKEPLYHYREDVGLP